LQLQPASEELPSLSKPVLAPQEDCGCDK
jgi:hypothetical protein